MGMKIGVMGAAAVAAWAIAGAAVSQVAVVTNPSWASVPGPHDMAEAYPMFASMADIGADVTPVCIVRADGLLSLCRVQQAAPEGLGFETAALQMTSAFRVNPLQVDGGATKSEVQFTIRFRLPVEDFPPWEGAAPSPEHVAASRAFLEALPAQAETRAELETMDLQVAPEREAKLRAMVLQMAAHYEEQFLDAEALAMARLVSPEALTALIERGVMPPRPSAETIARANDVLERRSMESMLRLRALYCAQFDCSQIPSSVPGQ